MKKAISFLRILSYYPKHSPLYFILYFLYVIVGSILQVFNSVYLLKIVFDSFFKQTSLIEMISILLLSILVNTLFVMFGNWFQSSYAPKCEVKIKSIMQKSIFEKASKLQLRFYDDDTFYNDYILALRESKTINSSTLAYSGALLANIVSITTIVSILFSIDIFIVFIVCFSVIMGFVIDVLLSRKNATREFKILEYEKKNEYYKRLFYLKDCIEEIKSLKNNKFIFDEYWDNCNELHNTNKVYSKWLVTLYFAKGVLDSIFSSFAIYFLLIYKLVISKTIGIGGVSAAINSVWRLSDQLAQLLGNFKNIYNASIFCNKIEKFFNIDSLDYSNKSGETMVACPKVPERIDLKNVKFSYDGKTDILKDINITIKPFQKIAIVGENGSGKTTLVNLLLGLYSTYEGKITLNDIPYDKYNSYQMKEYFSCLFQDFNIYAFSLKDNVVMDDNNTVVESEVISALNMAGYAKGRPLSSHDLEIVLQNEFDECSTELSGGEKQRVALARILYSRSCIVVLDEPSSAQDPISESNFNDILMSAFDDRTVIFISHRLFSTRKADCIFLLSEGKVEESGTHDELMNLGGVYAKMYNLQKDKYSL